MTASNLAVCFAPSLFHMYAQNASSSSPKRGRKTSSSTSSGTPEPKELADQKAAHECLTVMISEGRKLFLVPDELLSKCRFSYIEQGDPVPLEELGRKRSSAAAADASDSGDVSADHAGYMESCVQGLLKVSNVPLLLMRNIRVCMTFAVHVQCMAAYIIYTYILQYLHMAQSAQT